MLMCFAMFSLFSEAAIYIYIYTLFFGLTFSQYKTELYIKREGEKCSRALAPGGAFQVGKAPCH